MSLSHRTNRLKLVGSPSSEKLPNGRFRLTFNLRPLNPSFDWYNANKDSIFAEYGTLQSAQMLIDGLNPRAGEAYTDMRLISAKTSGGDQYTVEFVYETLTSGFVEITDPTVEVQENGLAKITKVYRAISGAKSANKIGISAEYAATNPSNTLIVSSSGEGSGIYNTNESFSKWTGIDADARYEFFNTGAEEGAGQWVWYDTVDSNPLYFSETNGYVPWEVEWPAAAGLSFNLQNNSTVYGLLANKEIEDNTAYAQLTEIYLEPGTLSRTEDFVGSQDSLVIEAIGPDPSTPEGFSLASKQESNFEGFQTNRFTFLKDNVELSRSEDLVGSQLSITTQVFNPTSDPTITDYSLARTEESDVDGIPTKQYTFLKPSILSVQQEFNETRDRITVRAFNKTSAEVDTALTEVTSNHKLIAESEDDFQGIKTSTYVYELDSHDVISTEENGLRTVTRSLILATGTDYDGVVGVTSITNKINTPVVPPEAGNEVTVYLAGFAIKDTSEFRVITERYIEAGTLSESEDNKSAPNTKTVQIFGTTTAPTIEGYALVSSQASNFDGIETTQFNFVREGVYSRGVDPGPQGLPNTRIVVISSIETEPTSNGITLSENVQNYDVSSSIKDYNYRFIEKVDGTSPTTGNIVTYQKNIDVRQHGVVSATGVNVAGSGGTSLGETAQLSIVPPSMKKVQATVAISISSNGNVSAPVAYNLSNVSCSATITNASVTPVGIEQGDLIEVAVFNTRLTSQSRSFPNCIKSNDSIEKSYSSPAVIIRDSDNLIGENLVETNTTTITLSGTGTAPATSGLYQEDADFIFTDANGVAYFRKTTYTV